MWSIQEAVVLVFPGIEGSHAIKLAKQDPGQKVIHGERIVRVLLDYPLVVLHCPVKVEVVETVKSDRIQRITGPVGRLRGRLRGLARREYARPAQHANQYTHQDSFRIGKRR